MIRPARWYVPAMADDVVVDADEAPPPKGKTAEAPEAKPGAPHLLLRVALGAAGLLLLVGFFLPWVKIESRPSASAPVEAQRTLMEYSGFQLASSDDDLLRAAAGTDTQRNLLWLIPVFGLAMTAIGFLGFRWSGPVAAILGVLLIGYGAVTVVIIFFQNTALGLWLILGGAFLAVASGAFSWARAHQAKRVEKGDASLKLPEEEA